MRMSTRSNYAFPQIFRPQVLIPAPNPVSPPPPMPPQPRPPGTPFDLSPKLLGDLAMLFERESRRRVPVQEQCRLFAIAKELDRLWRVKTASTRRRGRR